MRRALTVLCLGALAASGLALSGPATAAPAGQASPVAAAAVPDELVVGYVAGASENERGRARGRAGAVRKERVVAAAADRTEVELVRLPAGRDRDAAIAELQSDPAVAYAEPNWIYTHQAKPSAKPGGSATPPVDYFANGSLWGMYGETSAPANTFGSQAAEAWAGGNTGSADVYVGVIDEGIQINHPDLAPNIGRNPGELAGNGIDDDNNNNVDDVHGWDFANGDSSVYDGGTRGSLDDHGTHVAGTIGAANETVTAVPSAGQSGVVGVNHKVKMISGKFLGRNGGTLANAIKAVDYFTDLKKRHGLEIVATNNSWGGGGFSQGLLDAIVRGAQADILFVAAAGNSTSDNDTTASYPSNYSTAGCPLQQTCLEPAGGFADFDAVIAVAAIDKAGALATFSSFGASTVDLGAPGVGIWSTTAYSGWSSYSGTSMATPHVTGGAALYKAGNSGATAADIKTALLESAVATPALKDKTVTGDRLDVSGF